MEKHKTVIIISIVVMCLLIGTFAYGSAYYNGDDNIRNKVTYSNPKYNNGTAIVWGEYVASEPHKECLNREEWIYMFEQYHIGEFSHEDMMFYLDIYERCP